MNKTEIITRLDYRTFYKSLLPSLKDNGKTEAMALCPFHDDHNPSLSVNLADGLYHCHACDAGGDVFRFYERYKDVDFETALADLGCMAGVEASSGKVVAAYEYKDQHGNVLYIKERIEPGRDGRSKEFVFQHLEGSKCVMGRGDNDAVPYNLQVLNKAEYAIIVEGEGKVEALREWDIVATCLDSGAKSPWRDDYLPHFQGKKRVILLPDNDNPGREYAKRIAQALHGEVGKIKIVELPGLEEKEDIIDWQKKGGTKDLFREIIRTTSVWTPLDVKDKGNSIPAPIESNLAGNELWQPVPITELKDSPPIDWVWGGYIARGRITELVGLWKSGKTTLVVHLLKEMAHGGELAGKSVTKAKVLIISEEDSSEWKERKDKYSLGDNIDLICLPFKTKPTKKEWEAFTLHIGQLASSYGLIVIDTIASNWSVADENNNSEVITATMPIRGWTEKGASVLIIHHCRKGEALDGQASRGAGGLPAFVDIILEFGCYDASRRDDTRRVLKGYSRRNETPKEVVIELTDDKYVLLGNKSEATASNRLATLKSILPTKPPGDTVEDIKKWWPNGLCPGERTLRNDLETLYSKGKIERTGEGKKCSPYRYYI